MCTHVSLHDGVCALRAVFMGLSSHQKQPYAATLRVAELRVVLFALVVFFFFSFLSVA